MAYPLPLPQQPRTTLPLQRLLDDEFAPVIRTHMRGIAFLEAYYGKKLGPLFVPVIFCIIYDFFLVIIF